MLLYQFGNFLFTFSVLTSVVIIFVSVINGGVLYASGGHTHFLTCRHHMLLYGLYLRHLISILPREILSNL